MLGQAKKTRKPKLAINLFKNLMRQYYNAQVKVKDNYIMKNYLLLLFTIFPMFAFADIIATYNNGNIEDVTVVSVGADEVVYKEGNAQKSIASSEVEGVLYDDGRFIDSPTKEVSCN